MLSKIKELIPKINFSLYLLIAFLLPLHQKSIGLFIGVLTVFSILELILFKNFSIKNKPIFIAGLLFFLIHLISVIYSSDKAIAWFDIEVKLSLLIFPILFSIQNQYLKKYNKLIFFTFVLSSFIGSVVMLYIPLMAYWGNGFEFLNHVREMRYLHPSYFSMYLIFSIGILIKYITENKNIIIYKYIIFVPIIFLVYLISLLQSKAEIITIIVVLFYLFMLAIIKLRSFLLKIAIFLLIISFSLIILQKSSRLQSMFYSVEQISSAGESKDETTGIRYEIWKIAAHQIKSNWLIGVGAGDIKSSISSELEDKHLDAALDNSLNIHNQFLETFLGQGILGLSLLIFLLYLGVKEAIKRKDWLLTVFLILITISFGPESMLNTQAGVIFFSFFYYFLFLFNTNNDKSIFQNYLK